MTYFDQQRFNALERAYLEPPDEGEEREDDADFLYESMRENQILGG